jgi:hypothetical protein
MALRSLPRIAGDYITMVQLIGEAPPEQLPDSRTLRQQLLALLEAVGKGGAELQLAQDEIDEARFALVCWADETILRSQWSGRDDWGAETGLPDPICPSPGGFDGGRMTEKPKGLKSLPSCGGPDGGRLERG